MHRPHPNESFDAVFGFGVLHEENRFSSADLKDAPRGVQLSLQEALECEMIGILTGLVKTG